MATIETNVSRFTSRGMSHYYLRNYREALDDFNEAIRQNPKEAVAFRYQGLVREKLNQVEEAITDYSMAIFINPEYDEVYVNRGRIKRELGQYKLAIWDFNEAIRINPHNAEAFEDRGKTKIKLGDAISGSEDLDKAHQLRNRWKIRRSLVPIVVLLLFFTITTTPAQTALLAEDIAEKALAATVYLEMKNSNGKVLGFGSGFFVKPNLIVTNYHVIEGAAQGTAKLVGKSTTYNIEGFTATDQKNDLAILKVKAYGVKPLPLGDSDTVRIGETVYVAGNPNGLKGTFSDGIISSRQDKNTKEWFQMTALISLGSSGGPVLNHNGEVIGVSLPWYRNSDDPLDTQPLNILIPSNHIKTLLTHSITAKPLGQDNAFISPDTYFRWGYMKLGLENYNGAIADLTETIRLAPKNVYAYFNRGIAKSYLGQYTDAIADWSEAIRLDPNFISAYVNRGFLKGELGQYIAAIADFNTVIQLKPNFALAHFYRGLMKDNLKQYAAAIKDFDTVILLDPDNPEAYNNRGAAKSELGQYAAAIGDWNTTIRLKPDYAEAYFNRGLAKGKLGRHTAAIADFDNVIRLKSNNIYAYFNRGHAKGMLGRTLEAKQDLQTALRLAEKAGDVSLKTQIEETLRLME